MRTFVRYGAVLTLVALTVGTATSSALGDTTGGDDDAGRITWTVEPVTSGGSDERVSIRHDIDPGDTVTDEVEVRNFGPSAATFRIYASDGVVGDSGAFDILPPEQEPGDGGSWVTFEDGAGQSAEWAETVLVHLEPESATVVPLTITVPEDAVPGDHPAGVVAEWVPEDEHNVQLTSRVGVRLHLRVAGELAAHVLATDPEVRWNPGWNPFGSGDLSVSYLLQNTGNVRLGTDSQLQVAGPFGLLPARVEDTRREILPGDQVRVVAQIPHWGLFWTDGQITVTPDVVGEDAPDVDAEASATEFAHVTVPWPQLAVLVLIAAALYFRRRRRRQAEHAVQKRIDAAVADAVRAPGSDREVPSRAEEATRT